jgi:hypothetical protein
MKQVMTSEANGNGLISLIKTPVHLAKEYLHRRPDPRYRPDFVVGETKETARANVEALRRDGIILLPGYFKEPLLGKLQAGFAKATQGRVDKYNPNSLLNNDILLDDPAFYDAALDDFLLEIISGYYQKPFAVALANAMRLMPSPAVRAASFQWHHDTRGRQVHMMVLLSEVTSKGQRMTYLRQSQDRYYSYARSKGEGSRFDLDVTNDPVLKDRIVDVVGPPGTVALFDANGLHSGNRNENEIRDALTFCYVSWRHFKKVKARRSDIAALPPAKREVMNFNPNLELLD